MSSPTNQCADRRREPRLEGALVEIEDEPGPTGHVPERHGNPLRLDPASAESWADCLAAWARQGGTELTLPLDEDGDG